jgi:hypothetical protein
VVPLLLIGVQLWLAAVNDHHLHSSQYQSRVLHVYTSEVADPNDYGWNQLAERTHVLEQFRHCGHWAQTCGLL